MSHVVYNWAMDPMQPSRANAMVYRKMTLSEQPSDFAYWQSQPPAARLAALEATRREFHGWTDDTQPRLQRVCTIVKR
jgi:hypothetical protein